MKNMADVIWGDVKNILDGDTFDIHVTHIGILNRFTYNEHERIRLIAADAPELSSQFGFYAKQQLERQLNGRHVKCVIRSRDKFGRSVCEVYYA